MQKTFSSKPRICVDIRQIHTSGPLRSNVKKCRKTFTRADNLKRNKGELVLDQETVYPIQRKHLQMTRANEQPTDKTLFNVFIGKTIQLDELPIKKGV